MATGCRATTKSGAPCRAPLVPGRTYCRAHDPELAAERLEWSRRGGRNRSNAARAARELEAGTADTAEITATLTRTLRRLEAGKIEPGVATALAGVAKALVSIRQAGEIEERVRELETRAGIVRLEDRRLAA